MNPSKTIEVGSLQVSNTLPFTLFGGMNVLESRELALEVASAYQEVTQKLGIPYVFKASFDKANRSSVSSFRGPGLEKGCEILAEIKETFSVPVISDVHEPYQAKPAAEVIDVLQLPAFLCRQTDLVVALAETGKPVNVKKPNSWPPTRWGISFKNLQKRGTNRFFCASGEPLLDTTTWWWTPSILGS